MQRPSKYCINNTGEGKRYQGAPEHIPDIEKRSVFVSSLTRIALVETGEQRSPKKIPARIAPPVYIEGIPLLSAMVIQITPMVAALPKEVPVRKETRQHRRKEASSMTDGLHMAEA